MSGVTNGRASFISLTFCLTTRIYIYRTSKPILHKNLCGGRTLSLEKFSSAFRARRDRFYEGV